MNRAKLAVARTQQFVRDHKTAIIVTAAVAATAVVCTKVYLKVIENTNVQPKELDIDLDDFYKTDI